MRKRRKKYNAAVAFIVVIMCMILWYLPSIAIAEPEGDFPDQDPDEWRLILVNKQHPIPNNYIFETGRIHNGLMVDERITGALDDMLSAAKEDGVLLLVISPYRSREKQQRLFDEKVSRSMRHGSSYLDAFRETAQAVTIPGSSEHEIGLAVDLTTKKHITLDAAYADSEGGIWLKEHCAEYGFILRYPEGKEDITGIEFEPWHFRYVGKETAAYIMEHDLTLEEYVGMLR
ncbi:MAG: M15 family metallopeptidase [Lachnospiraceae bacterium]|nr:M15 family metallopeptidase [Lachnospiraceae bacterium]